jgi:ribose/xylose/arabinose/galactoside ABC-type transport system permease subunit
LFGLTGAVLALVAVAIAGHLWLGHLRSGRHLYALGCSPTAAHLVGIERRRSWLLAFGAGGLLAALAGLVEMAQTGSLQSSTGTGYELQAIAAAVIGGVSISGGRGSTASVVLGALLLSLVYNAVVLLEVSRYHYGLVTGLLLLGAVLIDRVARRGQR